VTDIVFPFEKEKTPQKWPSRDVVQHGHGFAGAEA
jgi:hypothetical protein